MDVKKWVWIIISAIFVVIWALIGNAIGNNQINVLAGIYWAIFFGIGAIEFGILGYFVNKE